MNESMSMLSLSTPMLKSQGELVSDIYYSPSETTVSLIECQYYTGKYFQSLPSSQFGSTTQVIIPNDSLVSDCYLNLTLPNPPADIAYPRGWGYQSIRYISMLWGSSNVSYLTISGQSLWQHICAEAESSEKLSELWRLGGEEIRAPLVAPAPGEDVPIATASVFLPLPWSSVSGFCKKKPFDTTLLNTPLTISITFVNSNALFSGNSANFPTRFDTAVFSTRQGELSNRSQGLAGALALNPESYMVYPFMHIQSESPPVFTGIRASTGGKVSIQLQNFLHSDLAGIAFGAVRATRRSAGTPINSFSYDTLTNVNLAYGGNTVYQSLHNQNHLFSLRDKFGGASWHDSVLTGAVAPFNSQPKDTYPIFIDFARMRSASFCTQFQNTKPMGQQTFNLSFNTETSEEYILYATYFYNAVNAVQGGQSTIVF